MKWFPSPTLFGFRLEPLMMRKVLFAVASLTFMMAIGMGTAYAQQSNGINFDAAIQDTVEELSHGLGRGTSIAVISMESDSATMSSYLIDSMIIAFVGMGGFTTINRAQLDLFAQELDFNNFEKFDDATAESIGRSMGIQVVVTGAFEPFGDFYRLSVRAIEVETSEVRTIYTENIRNNNLIAFLLGAAGRRIVQDADTEKRARNWFSIELTYVGFGLHYERYIVGGFSLGFSAFVNTHDLRTMSAMGALAVVRFYPGGFPFYLECGTGWGLINSGRITERGDRHHMATGLMFAPALGARIGGRRTELFVNPFVSLPMVLREWTRSEGWTWRVSLHLRAGVGAGVRW